MDNAPTNGLTMLLPLQSEVLHIEVLHFIKRLHTVVHNSSLAGYLSPSPTAAAAAAGAAGLEESGHLAFVQEVRQLIDCLQLSFQPA